MDLYFSSKHIWRRPPRIQIFLWLVENNSILTKDNLVKTGCVGDPKCTISDNDESTSHSFFEYSVAKVIWGIVATCFGAKNVPRSLNQVWKWVRV
jgi:hypothetical protein